MTRIVLLYDGHCGLCRRSVRVLRKLDWMHRLSLIDFWDTDKRHSVAPDLSIEQLDRAMHVRFIPKGTGKNLQIHTYKGFDAFRAISWHLPPLWPLAPLLSLPGIPFLGRLIYARIAERRKRCDHESCLL